MEEQNFLTFDGQKYPVSELTEHQIRLAETLARAQRKMNELKADLSIQEIAGNQLYEALKAELTSKE